MSDRPPVRCLLCFQQTEMLDETDGFDPPVYASHNIPRTHPLWKVGVVVISDGPDKDYMPCVAEFAPAATAADMFASLARFVSDPIGREPVTADD